VGLVIHNAYRQDVWVAVIYPSSFCSTSEGTPWAKKGWWHISPGNRATVIDGDLSPQWFYYVHADAPDGTEWISSSGSSTPDTEEDCPYDKFDWCDNTSSSTSVDYGFAEIYSSRPNKIVNLVG
jgi:hypothetical protein